MREEEKTFHHRDDGENVTEIQSCEEAYIGHDVFIATALVTSSYRLKVPERIMDGYRTYVVRRNCKNGLRILSPIVLRGKGKNVVTIIYYVPVVEVVTIQLKLLRFDWYVHL